MLGLDWATKWGIVTMLFCMWYFGMGISYGMMFMAKKTKAPKAQDLIDEDNDEDNDEEQTVELEDLTVEERLERLEQVLEKVERELQLLSAHTHDRLGRVVVPY